MGMFYGLDFTYSLVSVTPHGIFEVISMILALTAALIITKLENPYVKTRSFMKVLRESKTQLYNIILVIIFCAILLAIAAIIEAHFATLIVQWFFV